MTQGALKTANANGAKVWSFCVAVLAVCYIVWLQFGPRWARFDDRAEKT